MSKLDGDSTALSTVGASPPNQATDFDTLIIGAGMSGLAAGIRLAHYEQRVCIVERHTTIGGLNSFYRLAGRNYDVGLHAVTNFTPRGAKRGPLARLLRQLRFQWDDFRLAPQRGSRIAWPDVSLEFTNDIARLEAGIADQFPAQIDNFRGLQRALIDYDDLDQQAADTPARPIVAQYITDPRLVEMLFCPLLYYGSARQNEMDWAQFSIMFRSIYLEGLGRPLEGVRLILKQLVRRYKELGGELRLRAGVRRLHADQGRVVAVELDDGERLTAKNVVSSAGWVETERLRSDVAEPDVSQAGQLSFVETISILDRQPADLGCNETIVFFNDHETFDWRRPDDEVDVRSGVICSPNNFAYEQPLPEGVMRITALANFDRWNQLSDTDYRAAKARWFEAVTASAVRFVPDFRRQTVATDMFTPTTIRRFTGHDNGAVYGAPQKHYDGRTSLENLYICGTDQGFVGIVGSIVSGFSIANRYLLTASS